MPKGGGHLHVICLRFVFKRDFIETPLTLRDVMIYLPILHFECDNPYSSPTSAQIMDQLTIPAHAV